MGLKKDNKYRVKLISKIQLATAAFTAANVTHEKY